MHLRATFRAGKVQSGIGLVRTASRGLERGARNAIVCLIGLLLALSGCASERSIVFIYYPNGPQSAPV